MLIQLTGQGEDGECYELQLTYDEDDDKATVQFTDEQAVVLSANEFFAAIQALHNLY